MAEGQSFNNNLILFTEPLNQGFMRRFLLTGVFVVIYLCSWTQSYQLKNSLLLIDEDGDTLQHAWAGGLETPQYGMVDIDLDGKKDLVAFDKEASRFVPFINTGSQDHIHFRFAPEFQKIFDSCPCITWALFEDANCDGLPDLFCRTDNADASVFQQNIHNDSVSFQLTYPELRVQRGTNNTVLSVNPTDIPGLRDLDYDGDLDFLVFGVNATTVTLIKNMAVERTGRCDTMILVRNTQCWGHFRESDIDNTAFVADTVNCPLMDGFKPQVAADHSPQPIAYDQVTINRVPRTMEPSSRAVLHAGSTTLILDLNADSTFDVLIGDTSFDEVYALYNAGTINYAFMDSVERNFPSQNVPISIPTFPSIFYLDINNDGIRDLLSAPHASSSFDNVSGTWLYLNEGADNKPDFQLEEQGFLQNEIFDVGSYAFPAFIDYNHDGLEDLLVGNLGYYDPDEPVLQPALALLENTGSNEIPIYQIRSRDFLGIRSSDNFPLLTEISPAAGDLTGDGLEDILLGNTLGTLYFFENTDPSSVNPFEFVSDTFAGIDVGRNSAPFLYDIDHDEDLDLFIGNLDGYIQFYENQGLQESDNGSSKVPVFKLIDEQWGDIRILDEFGGEFSRGFARPVLTDYDGDGETELLVGGVVGQVYIYENVENALTDSLVFSGYLANHDFGVRAAPAVSELIGGQSPVFVVGNVQGGLQLVSFDSTGLVSYHEELAPHDMNLLIYPNPVRDILTIQSTWVPSQTLEIIIYDLAGKKALQRRIQRFPVEWNLNSLQAGYYILEIQATSGRQVFRLVKQ